MGKECASKFETFIIFLSASISIIYTSAFTTVLLTIVTNLKDGEKRNIVEWHSDRSTH